MKKKAKLFDDGDMRMATMISARTAESVIKQAQKLLGDPDKERRLQRGLCKACHYTRVGGLAGQAFTDQPCACCKENQTYSSTNTDALCLPCATKHDLCKHCGGDRDMDQQREAI